MLITPILLFKFGNILINFRILQENNAWVLYNITQMAESIILPIIAFLLCDNKKYGIRGILLAIMIFNFCSLFQYILLIFSPKYFYATTVIFICGIIPFLYRYIIESLQPESDPYMYTGCYLVYKRPNSILGSICALITSPYGHCSLVVNNIEFTYKKGVIIERKLEITNRLTFKKIAPIRIDEVRKLVGSKWSLRNNCFTTFRHFKK